MREIIVAGDNAGFGTSNAADVVGLFWHGYCCVSNHNQFCIKYIYKNIFECIIKCFKHREVEIFSGRSTQQ